MEVNNKKWIDNNGTFSYGVVPGIFETLPPAVYELGFDGFQKCFILSRISEDFKLPPKIYNLEDELIKRVCFTYQNLNQNFGIILKGLKGTGKTIVGKIICNELKLPVILVTRPFTDIASFINSISQDVVMFFDEFEKIYELYSHGDDEDTGAPGETRSKHSISNLLMLMDGAFTSQYKRLFILTTNKDYLPDAMIARPSRIRYIRNFNDLHADGIMEILQDLVVNKELIPGLVAYLKELEILTVDIVRAIADEANLYNTADPEFYNIFNTKKTEVTYDLYEILEDNGKKEEKRIATGTPLLFENMTEDYTFYNPLTRQTLGDISFSDLDNQTLTTKFFRRVKKGNSVVNEEIERCFRWEKAKSCHKSFYGMGDF